MRQREGEGEREIETESERERDRARNRKTQCISFQCYWGYSRDQIKEQAGDSLMQSALNIRKTLIVDEQGDRERRRGVLGQAQPSSLLGVIHLH